MRVLFLLLMVSVAMIETLFLGRVNCMTKIPAEGNVNLGALVSGIGCVLVGYIYWLFQKKKPINNPEWLIIPMSVFSPLAGIGLGMLGIELSGTPNPWLERPFFLFVTFSLFCVFLSFPLAVGTHFMEKQQETNVGNGSEKK
jgi:hypothetical protein